MQWLTSFRGTVFASLATATIVAISGPAVAKQQPDQLSAKDEEIIVTGQKHRLAEFRNLITNQFNVSGGSSNTGQYPRFSSPVCPSVAGLSERQSNAIEARIREIAEMAEIPVATAKCDPNIFVAVIEDGAAEIQLLRSKKSRLFASLTHSKRDAMEQSGGPVYSWKATQTIGSDTGHSAGAGSITLMADAPGGSNGGSSAALGDMMVAGQRTHVKSKISKSTTEGIAYSYLLIESKALEGVSASQLADYAAMVSLIDIDVSSKSDVPTGSILGLFSNSDNKEDLPQSLSGGDLLLLQGLYKVPANVNAPLQRSAMLHTMQEASKSEDE